MRLLIQNDYAFHLDLRLEKNALRKIPLCSVKKGLLFEPRVNA